MRFEEEIMSTTLSRLSRPQGRSTLQSYILLGLGVIFLLGALLLRLNPRTYPVGLFLFGLGLLVAAAISPDHLVIAGLFFTLVGAVFALRGFIPFDNALLIIVIGLALLGIALMARRGYIKAGALTPALFTLLVGIIQYPPTGIARLLASFVLSLWFPGVGLLILGLAYWFLSTRKA
jgi:hypothetical protein